MEKPILGKEKFSSREEELLYLGERMKEVRERPENALLDNDKLYLSEIKEYAKLPSEEILHPEYKMTKEETDSVLLELVPEKHDETMAELLGVIRRKGIKNALNIVAKTGNTHLEDDFHRFLVQYVKEGYSIGLKDKDRFMKSLRMTLYEATLPQEKTAEKPLAELVSSMEQFYAGMLSISDKKTYGEIDMSFEIAISNIGEEVVFYVAVPDVKRDLFEKQFMSVFPEGRLLEKKDDYNIFNEKGESIGAYGALERSFAFSLKTYKDFDYDPLNVLLSSFSKIEKAGEGASIQIIFNPAGGTYNKQVSKTIEKINLGKTIKEATDFNDSIGKSFLKVGKDIFGFDKKKDDKKEAPSSEELENIKIKAGSPIIETNIRLVVSAGDKKRALDLLEEIKSSLNQLQNSFGNSISWKHATGRRLRKMIADFTYRRFNKKEKLLINLKELSTIYHFPKDLLKSSPHLKKSKAGTAPAPADISESGILLGINKHQGLSRKIYFSPDDRLRHFYTIGQTGTGKTTLLKNMIAQDIRNGEGVCFIDPHGSDIDDVLALVPKERLEDVIYFDPARADMIMTLNMLEYDKNHPEQKTFVVNEMLSIFDKLFDMKTAGGPMFEQYFRNSVLLAIDDPNEQGTLLDVSRVLSDKSYRDMKLERTNNIVVREFWKNIAEKAGGEASLGNIVPYITSKFDVFLSNDIMRPIIAGKKSSFNFRDIMDNKKILLVNLSKGRLGDINSNLIGLILVGKILMSALSRADVLGQSGREIAPFYLYIDEFQNVTTPSIATILSEARKYKLSLNIAHQFIAQLDEKIKDAVFGNVGSMAVFRVGSDDAEYIQKMFDPTFTISDILNIDNKNAYLKMLFSGRPERPFSMEVPAPELGDRSRVDDMKKFSYLKYGRSRAEVEEEIARKYQSF